MRQQDNSIYDDTLEMTDSEDRGDGSGLQLLALRVCWAFIPQSQAVHRLYSIHTSLGRLDSPWFSMDICEWVATSIQFGDPLPFSVGEKKLGRVACPDPWKSGARNTVCTCACM